MNNDLVIPLLNNSSSSSSSSSSNSNNNNNSPSEQHNVVYGCRGTPIPEDFATKTRTFIVLPFFHLIMISTLTIVLYLVPSVVIGIIKWSAPCKSEMARYLIVSSIPLFAATCILFYLLGLSRIMLSFKIHPDWRQLPLARYYYDESIISLSLIPPPYAWLGPRSNPYRKILISWQISSDSWHSNPDLIAFVPDLPTINNEDGDVVIERKVNNINIEQEEQHQQHQHVEMQIINTGHHQTTTQRWRSIFWACCIFISAILLPLWHIGWLIYGTILFLEIHKFDNCPDLLLYYWSLFVIIVSWVHSSFHIGLCVVSIRRFSVMWET